MDLGTALFTLAVVVAAIVLLVAFFRLAKHRDIEDTMGWSDDNPDEPHD